MNDGLWYTLTRWLFILANSYLFFQNKIRLGSCYCIFFACLFRELGIGNLILNVLTTCKPSKLVDFGDLPLITLNIVVE